MAYRFIQSKTPRWIPRQVTDNVFSSITKWINHAVFLISVTAAQIRKLVGGEQNSVQLPQRVIFRPQRSWGKGLGDQAQVKDLWFSKFCWWWVMTSHFVFWHSFTGSTWNRFTLFLFKYVLSIMEVLGSASVMSQKMRRRSTFSRACLWTHAQQSSSEISGNCGLLPSVYRGTIWEVVHFMFHFKFGTSSKNIECFCQQWWHTSAL